MVGDLLKMLCYTPSDLGDLDGVSQAIVEDPTLIGGHDLCDALESSEGVRVQHTISVSLKGRALIVCGGSIVVAPGAPGILLGGQR